MEMYDPPHPGKVLLDALDAIPMTITEFAAHLGISRVTLSRVVNGRAGITPDMSIKLSEAFGQNQGNLWFKMQNSYDYWHASRAKRKKIRPLKLAA